MKHIQVQKTINAFVSDGITFEFTRVEHVELKNYWLDILWADGESMTEHCTIKIDIETAEGIIEALQLAIADMKITKGDNKK